MLSPRTTSCSKCADIESALADIDCKINEISVNMYNNIVFMLNKPIPRHTLKLLLHYRRILMYKICNPGYAGCYSTESIINKVKLLKYK